MKRGKPEKYLALAEEIRKLIHSGQLRQNDALPSERKLARQFEVNHLTVRKALKVLEGQGMLYKVPSHGNFVGKKPPAQKKNGMIGLLFPDMEIFFFEVLSELEKKMGFFGFHPIVHISHGSTEREEEFLSFCRNENLDALIAVPDKRCAEAYKKLNIPTVFFDVFIEGLSTPHVIVDDFSGAESAVEHLISLGHTRIAHIGGMGDETSEKRFDGYAATLKKHDIEIKQSYIKQKDYTRQWGYYAMQELMKEKKAPTALFCGNDTIAAGALRMLKSTGISCPSEFSVVGFGNTMTAQDLDMSTVSQPCDIIADAVWKNLQTVLKGGSPAPETRIGTELILRSTTARCL
ncbi:MAG: hypothetical protein A2017_12905 [Lentisphaerae bacterium GWF2_44_16]|nr:MAG: hypothetical protein A2017_12905 [Lentisphaerae bacterium GWF2_44_16]